MKKSRSRILLTSALFAMSLLALCLSGCPQQKCPDCECTTCKEPVSCNSDGGSVVDSGPDTKEGQDNRPPERRLPPHDGGTPERCPSPSCPDKKCPAPDCGAPPPPPKKVTQCSEPTTGFYNLPPVAPASMSKGSVIRCETFLERTKLSMSLDPQVTIAGKPALYGLKIVRIVYLTEPRPGLKRWTSSLLYVPTNNDGSCRKSAPLALVAHGTTGLASTCGPSRYPAFGVQYMTMPLVARGFLTIAPDYMGLGLPSRSQHPYLVKEPTIASMMDAVRAVRELSRQGSLAGCAGTKLVMVGHSQGGHAVLKAGAQTRKELPGVQHAGTVSFAPALGSAGVWLEGLKANFRTTPGTVYLLSLYWAAEQYYGYKKNWLRADFRKRWSVLTQQMCFSELDALIRGAYPQLGNIFTQEFLNATLTCETSGNCSGYEPFYSMVRNNISGTDKPNAPTLLVQGSRDSVVTTSSVRCIADRLRNHGSQHKSCLISNASHASVVSSGWKQVLPWLEALVRGQTPPSLSCSNSWPACK